jgi:putative transcriptional regulator
MKAGIKIRLSTLMGERKLSKRDVAEMAGVDDHVIADYYYERVKMFRADTLVKLCRALGLKSINELIEVVPDEKS